MATAKTAAKKKAVKVTPKKAVKKPAPATPAPLFTKKTMALYAKACKWLKLNPDDEMPYFKGEITPRKKSVIAYSMLTVIIEYVNKSRDKNWKPDYHAANDKYWTWHRVKADADRPSGFGFSDSSYGYVAAYAYVGSRLCFATLEDEKAYREPLEELYIAYKL